MKHTSGPWQSHDDQTTEGFITIIANIDGEHVNGSHSFTYDVVARCEDQYGERLANAAANVRLVCAAPDALKLAKWIDHHFDNQDMNHVDFRIEVAKLARDFLAKAVGSRAGALSELAQLDGETL